MESYLTAEISASALRANASVLRRQLARGVKICACAKCDAYGHGLRTVLNVLAEQVDWLGVATPDEALLIRDMGYMGPAMVFFSACAYADQSHLDSILKDLISRDVTLTVVSSEEVGLIDRAASRAGKNAHVHVKVDTGMMRSGAPLATAPSIIDRLRRQQHVRLTGLYTHFAAADEADKTFTRLQLQRLKTVAKSCGDSAGLMLHAANSAALIDLPETHLNMVRPGIALYGYQPSDQMQVHVPLEPTLRLTGKLMQIKQAAAGTRCGYGLTYQFDRPSLIGLVPIGYGDGYFLRLSNKATMRVRGRHVPVRGRVSMDQTIVDLTDCPDAKIGDEVEIISPNSADPHSVENLARLADTVRYEITTLLGHRARRVLID